MKFLDLHVNIEIKNIKDKLLRKVLPARVTKLAFVLENRISAPNNRQLAIV
jgi:hypothetical protein